MAEINDLDIVDASNIARFPEGQAPSTVNNGARELEGLTARGIKDALEGTINSTGTAGAYVVAANRTLTAYYDGMRQGFHANHANTGAATLNIDALGIKAITKLNDLALAASDIATNQYVDVVYSASADAFQMQTPATIQVATGTFTRDMTAVDGDVSITGVGFKPRVLLFTAAVHTTVGRMSIGFDGDGAANFYVADNYQSIANTWATAQSSVISLIDGPGIAQNALVKTYDADGFTLTWDKIGTPGASTATINYLALR